MSNTFSTVSGERPESTEEAKPGRRDRGRRGREWWGGRVGEGSSRDLGQSGEPVGVDASAGPAFTYVGCNEKRTVQQIFLTNYSFREPRKHYRQTYFM